MLKKTLFVFLLKLTNLFLDETSFKRYNEELPVFKPRRVSMSNNSAPITLTPQRRMRR